MGTEFEPGINGNIDDEKPELSVKTHKNPAGITVPDSEPWSDKERSLNKSEDLLVIKVPFSLTDRRRQFLYEEMLKAKKSGVVLVPKDCEIVVVPKNIEVRHEEKTHVCGNCKFFDRKNMADQYQIGRKVSGCEICGVRKRYYDDVCGFFDPIEEE